MRLPVLLKVPEGVRNVTERALRATLHDRIPSAAFWFFERLAGVVA
jgi:hypothetical protein